MQNLKGIKKVVSESYKLVSGTYLQLNLDVDTRELWVDWFVGTTGNNWKIYHDGSKINLGFIDKPMTMKEIRDMIEESANNPQFDWLPEEFLA